MISIVESSESQVSKTNVLNTEWLDCLGVKKSWQWKQNGSNIFSRLNAHRGSKCQKSK